MLATLHEVGLDLVSIKLQVTIWTCICKVSLQYFIVKQ